VSGSIGYHQPTMAHMSNRERIARAAEEARLTAAEKAAKKVTKKPTGSRAERAAKSVRMKVVWEVWNVAGTAVKSFPYPDKAQAEAETEALTRSTGRTHILRPNKVPMD
jgi:uncharacterized membrane protein